MVGFSIYVGVSFARSFLIKMINPFLVASRELGGLALSVEQVGIVYGTIGILFLTIGGIMGFSSFRFRVGLKNLCG